MKVEPLEVKQELEEDETQENERDKYEFSELSVIIDRDELKKEYGIEALELAVNEQCETFTDVSGSENKNDLEILYMKHAVKAEVVIGPTEIIDCNRQAIRHDVHKKQISSSKKLCCEICSQIFTLNVALNAHKKKCNEKYQAKPKARGRPKAKEDKENRTPIDKKDKSTVKVYKKTIKPDKKRTKLKNNAMKLNKIAMKPNTVKLDKNKMKLNKKAIKHDTNTVKLDKNTMKLNKNLMKTTNTAKFLKNTMKLNKIKINDKKPFACTICQKTFTLIMNLKRHNQAYHYQTLSFVCKNCGKEFIRKDYLTRHMKVCRAVLSEQKNNSTNNKNVHECVCGKIFNDSSSMRRHKRKYCKILAIPKTSYVCVCGVIIEEPSKIMHHEKKNCKILALPKKNSKCVTVTDARRKTAIPSNLDPDDKKIPVKSVEYIPESKCKCICGKIIIDPSNLARHKKKYCKILAKKSTQLAVTCDCCNKVFGNGYLLECHRKVVGTNSKKYDCDYCDKSYSEKRNLTEHIGRHHCESLEQKCKICNKVFSTKRYLMKHQDIHKSLSYLCKFCNKILRSRWGHRGHEKKCKYQK